MTMAVNIAYLPKPENPKATVSLTSQKQKQRTF